MNIDLNGIMIGATCAALRVVVTSSTAYNATGFIVHYKKQGDPDFTPAPCTAKSILFRDSSWEIDVTGLTEETEYEVYVTFEEGGSVLATSPTRTFTTIETGIFEIYWDYWFKESPSVPSLEPTPRQVEKSEEIINEVIEKMCAVGLNLPDINVYIPENYFSGATAMTPDGIRYKKAEILMDIDDYLHNQGVRAWAENNYFGAGWVMFSVDYGDLEVMLHELRHYFGFSVLNDGRTGNNDGTGLGLATVIYHNDDDMGIGIHNPENFKETASFFTLNGGESDVYIFYRENSCRDEAMLYDYFLIKSLVTTRDSKNLVNILDFTA